MSESDREIIPQPPAAPIPPRRPFVPREERDRLRLEAMQKLTVGDWLEGRITSVVPFGAFVDLGGIDGLVHISQLGAGGYVEKAEDIVQPGQTVRVRVVEIDQERQRIGLSMREPNAPRAPRPAPTDRPATGGPFNAPPAVRNESAPAGDDGSGGGPVRRDRVKRGNESQFRQEGKPRNNRRREMEDSEEWRAQRGGAAQDYYAIFDEVDNEPAPTTPEELVARFNKGRQ